MEAPTCSEVTAAAKNPEGLAVLLPGYQSAELFLSLKSVSTGIGTRDLVVLGQNFWGQGAFCKVRAGPTLVRPWSFSREFPGVAPMSSVLAVLPSDI